MKVENLKKSLENLLDWMRRQEEWAERTDKKYELALSDFERKLILFLFSILFLIILIGIWNDWN